MSRYYVGFCAYACVYSPTFTCKCEFSSKEEFHKFLQKHKPPHFQQQHTSFGQNVDIFQQFRNAKEKQQSSTATAVIHNVNVKSFIDARAWDTVRKTVLGPLIPITADVIFTYWNLDIATFKYADTEIHRFACLDTPVNFLKKTYDIVRLTCSFKTNCENQYNLYIRQAYAKLFVKQLSTDQLTSFNRPFRDDTFPMAYVFFRSIFQVLLFAAANSQNSPAARYNLFLRTYGIFSNFCAH